VASGQDNTVHSGEWPADMTSYLPSFSEEDKEEEEEEDEEE
jgi:hypothetical protein